MPKPTTHSKIQSKKFGGKPEDYLKINELMDCSKGAFSDNRHRTITHNSWFLYNMLELVCGKILINSDGKEIPVREIGEAHVLEDFGYIPTLQDYLQEMQYCSWMHGEGVPPSCKNLNSKNLNKTNLNKTNLNKTNLNKTNLNKTNLNKTNLNKEITQFWNKD